MKKFILSLFILVLLVGTVYAFEFDNVKKYDEETKTITIKNSLLGINWLSYGQVAEYTLIRNTDICLSKCEAEGTTILYDKSSLFQDMRFKNRKGENKIIDFQTYILKNISQTTWNEIYSDKSNKTLISNKSITRTHEEYVPYNFEELSVGNYRWKIKATKDIHESIDWIGSSNGIELTEWAWWDVLPGDFEVFNNTGADTFTVPAGVSSVNVLVVGAGGGGGNTLGGGGGAGGLTLNESYTTNISEGNIITVVVGVGGAGSTASSADGGTGGNSTFGTLSMGGGGGASSLSSGDPLDGASGGGASRANTGGTALFSGTQGFDGGDGAAVNAGGGGGGMSAVGQDGSGNAGGDGGNGNITIWGLIANLSCGGGGPGIGGDDGAGGCPSAGAGNSGSAGDDADANSGSGGGGGGSDAGNFDGGAGGSGLVIVRFNSSIIPTIAVFSPTNTTLKNPTIFFNATTDVTITEFVLNYNGTNITSFSINTTLEVEDGFHHLFLYANGTSDPTAWGLNDSVFFSVDTSPVINVFSPENKTHTTSTIYFNATNSTEADVWIVNYNGTNVTLSDINTTLEVEDGTNFNLLLYANGTGGTFGLNSTIFFSVDTSSPQITVDNPNSTFIFIFHEIDTNITVNWTVTDSFLDTCILEYNGVNETVTCLDNSTEINVTDFANKSLIFYVNDTLGNANSSSVNWSYRLFQTIETFDTTVFEGQLTIFTLELLTNGSTITLANLSYNNTENFGTITNNGGDNFTITKTITVPSVSVDTNVSFFWVIEQNIFSYTYEEQNQTIQDISIDDCSLNTNVLYNFTMVDEKEQSFLVHNISNTTGEVELKLFSFSSTILINKFNALYTKVNPFGICINNTFGNASYNADVLVKYKADGYDEEFYNIQNETVNSSSFTINITLYDLNTSQSQIFELVVKDPSFLTIGNALVQIERKYIQNGTFKIVEIPKTDENGEAVAHLVVDNTIYNFIIKKFGVTIREFNNVIPVCQNPSINTCVLNFNAFSSAIIVPDYASGDDFNFTLDYNSSSKVVLSIFVIPSGKATFVSLNVTQSDALGTSVCSDFLTSASGTLSCTVPNTFGNATLTAKLFKGSNFQAFGQIKIDQDPSDIYGTSLVVLALLVLITLIGVGVSDNPIYTVIFLMVGVVLLFTLNIIANNGFIGATATILFLVIAIILVIINARRNS